MDNYKILFVSLGCDKNLVDTEKMLGMLNGRGFVFTDNEQEADIIVVNTCCFINDAKEESIQTLLDMASLKQTAKCRLLIAAGCLAQRYESEIMTEIPEVDGILGTASYDKIVELILDALGHEHVKYMLDVNRLPENTAGRIVTTGGYYAHLKIAEGCDKHCTYCIIPSIRGTYRSVPMEELLSEARRLVDGGVRELILVAQETTLYGVDLYGKKSLHVLLEKLCEIEELRWIRILYCYPEEIYDELIAVIAKEEKICHYLDMPIQHASDSVLKRMGRKTNKQQLMDIVQKLKERIPDIALRTTLITGFPGETEEDHEEVMSFVQEMKFDRLGVFTYSPEEGTPAEKMEDRVPEETKELYRDEIMELQQTIAFEKAQSMIGRVLDVMIEGKLPEEGVYVARTYMDSPGIDGNIFVPSDFNFMSGDFVTVRVTEANDYDLIGELIEEGEDYEFTE